MTHERFPWRGGLRLTLSRLSLDLADDPTYQSTRRQLHSSFQPIRNDKGNWFRDRLIATGLVLDERKIADALIDPRLSSNCRVILPRSRLRRTHPKTYSCSVVGSGDGIGPLTSSWTCKNLVALSKMWAYSSPTLRLIGSYEHECRNAMKRVGFLLLAAPTLAGIVAYMAHASGSPMETTPGSTE